MSRNKLKIIFLVTVLAQLFTAQAVLAQTGTVNGTVDTYSGLQASIQQFLCTPTDTTASQTTGNSIGGAASAATTAGAGTAGTNNAAAGDLYTCINRLYRFAIILASAGAVLYIVIAGYMYMASEGNSESINTAKSYVTSAITALVILFAGYILLRALNPDLIQFRNIQPPSVTPASTTVPTLNVAPGQTGSTATGSTAATNTNTSCNQTFSNVQPSTDYCNSAAGSCVDVSNYTATHDCSSNNGICLLSANSAARAQTLINTFNTLASGSGCSLKISAAIEGSTGPSVSSCHKNGTCVDFNILPSYSTTCQQIFYNAAQQSAAVSSFLDEYNSSCVANSTTGGNIHVIF